MDMTVRRFLYLTNIRTLILLTVLLGRMVLWRMIECGSIIPYFTSFVIRSHKILEHYSTIKHIMFVFFLLHCSCFP